MGTELLPNTSKSTYLTVTIANKIKIRLRVNF